MPASQRPLTLLAITFRNLYRQPLRTTLTTLGVSVGVVAIVAFGALSSGLWASVTASIHFSQGDFMIFQAGAVSDILSTLDEKDIGDYLKADPEVERVVPTLWQIMGVENMPFGFLLGMHPADITDQAANLIEGRAPTGPDEVALGTVAVRVLNKKLGADLHIARRKFKVVGIFETDVVLFNGAVVMPLPTLQDIARKLGQVTSFQVKVRPGADPHVVGQRLVEKDTRIVFIANADQYKRVDQGLEIVRASVALISVLATLIGAVIVMNTMWMAVHERTREIGILRALGWSRGRIVIMVLCESAVVGFCAFLTGSLMGVALAKGGSYLPVARQFLEPVFDWPPFMTALAVSVALSALGGLLPAWRAARISPVEALRYE